MSHQQEKTKGSVGVKSILTMHTEAKIVNHIRNILINEENAGNSLLVSQLCSDVQVMLRNEEIHLTSIDMELKWMLLALERCPDLTPDIFAACTLLLDRNTNQLSPETSNHVLDSNSILQKLAHSGDQQQHARQIIIMSIQYTNYSCLISFLMTPQLTSCELVLNSLKILRTAIEENSAQLEVSDTKRLLSVVWRYMCFGEVQPIHNAPLELQPSSFTLPTEATNLKKSVERRKPPLHGSFEDLMAGVHLPISSDTQWETSRTVQSCIRHQAVCLLIAVVRVTAPATMFEYWAYLIFPGCPSLRHIIHNDWAWRVRLVALIAIEELLASARPFLTFAEEPRTAVTSFTTLSETLGTTLIKLHGDIMNLLTNSSLPIIKYATRCLSILVRCTPYQRISSLRLVSVARALRNLTECPDPSIQLDSLTVLHSIVKLDVVSANIDTEIDWILDRIMENITNTSSIGVTVECLQLLATLATNYSQILNSHVDEIQDLFKIALISKHSEVRIQAGRSLEVIGVAIKEKMQCEHTGGMQLTVQECAVFWQVLIHSLLTLVEDEQHIQARTTGCDCVGSIDSKLFQTLPRHVQILVITMLFAATRDSEGAVRGAAIRALTRGVLEAGRTEDFGFVADVVCACVTLTKDPSLFVRTKAAWSLSNLTDALLLNRNGLVDEDLPDQTYYELIEVTLIANADNDKVKCNVIRAMGNLLRLSTEEQLKQNKYSVNVVKIIQALVKNLTTGRDMKIKWNSCYAFANMLKNPHMYDIRKSWDGMVFPELLKLAVNCSNFKVRTNACLALSSPALREYYDRFWFPIWAGLIQVLDSCQHMDDFKEFKHRDTFVEQVCLSIAHLASISSAEDICVDHELYHLHADVFRRNIRRCQEQVVPEKANVFSAAIGHLNSMVSSNLTPKQISCLTKIIQIFSNDDITCDS